MNSLIPISHELPVPAEGPFRPIEPDRLRLRELLGIVMQRAWLALTVAALLFIIVMAIFWRMTPTYMSVGSIMIEPRRENMAAAEREPSQNGMPPDTSAIDTQVEVLRSHALAEDVVRRMKLYQDPEFNPRVLGSAPFAGLKLPFTNRSTTVAPFEPSPALVTWVANRLQARTRVRRVGLTYVVQVGVLSADPRKAARIANGIMDIYLQRQLQQKIDTVTRANRELGGSLERMRADAEAAEARVQEYKTANNLFSAEGATMAEQEVSTLNQQIAAAKADTAEKQARLSQALAQVRRGSGGADVGAALGSDTIRELRKQEAETSVKLAQLKADFKPEYPEVKRTQAQLNDLHAQIQAEINRILSSLRAEATAASQRQGSLLGSRGQAQGGLVANSRAQVGLVGLQQKADATKQIYEAYLNRAKEVAAAGSFQQPDASVASAAALPMRPVSPNMKMAFALAVFLGVVGGAASILVAELWDRGLRSRSDVERDLGVPFAGVLPDFETISTKRGGPAAPADYLVNHPFSSFAEAFRNLRAFLMLAHRSGPAKLVAITSAVPREGKSITSFCLARTLALSGSRVVLVDCDVRQRGVTKLLGGADIGVAEVIQNKASLADAIVRDPKTTLWVLPAGGTGEIPYDLFSREETDQLLQDLREQFDYVVLDTPPVLGVADARILAAKADRVLYVVQWNKTPVRAAQSGIDTLHESGANVAGALLSKVNVRQQARYGYGDSSDYFHYYRDYYITAA